MLYPQFSAQGNDGGWDPLDPLIQLGPLVLGDGRDSSYSDTHHILKRDKSTVHDEEASPQIHLEQRHDHSHHHHHHHHHEHNHGSIANADSGPDAGGVENVGGVGDHIHSHTHIHSHSHSKRSDLEGHGYSRIYGRHYASPHQNLPRRITLSEDGRRVQIQHVRPDGDFRLREESDPAQGLGYKRLEGGAHTTVRVPSSRLFKKTRRDEPAAAGDSGSGSNGAEDDATGTSRGVQGTIDVVVSIHFFSVRFFVF